MAPIQASLLFSIMIFTNMGGQCRQPMIAHDSADNKTNKLIELG
jgi:hypothetical protein